MPSPFPGMDPFIESQAWRDFHHHFISGIFSALVHTLSSRYIVRVEENVYVQEESQNGKGMFIPDLSVLRDLAGHDDLQAGGVAVMAEPTLIHLPMQVEVRVAYLEVRLIESHEVVVVIELLSPTNKRPKSKAQAKYLSKRSRVIDSSAHFIEIDLLRGGERMPMDDPLPDLDYYVLVSRTRERPAAQLWARKLADRLPTVPVPLSGDDPDASLDLQQVFDNVYDLARYSHTINYGARIDPPLTTEQSAWVSEVMGGGALAVG